MQLIDLSQFKRTALQFSGGKDSLACLYLLRDQLDRLTVYWLNTGDVLPETAAVVDEVRAWIPNFVEVKTDVIDWRDRYGMPTDLLPANSHFIGISYGLGGLKLTNRFDCCHHNIMSPMHHRMLDDGVDVVIRGTKMCDGGRIPTEGKTDFYTIVLPLKDWTHRQVFDYLREVNAPVNPVYEHFQSMSAPECVGCTAWWGDGKSAYLRSAHPELLQPHKDRLQAIKLAMQSHLDELESELRG